MKFCRIFGEFFTQKRIKNLLCNKSRIASVRFFILCGCNFSLHLKKRFYSYMYLGECPKIEDGRHFHENEAWEFFLFCFVLHIFHTDHNKHLCTMNEIGGFKNEQNSFSTSTSP